MIIRRRIPQVTIHSCQLCNCKKERNKNCVRI